MSYKLDSSSFGSHNKVILERSDLWRYLGATLFLLVGLGCLIPGAMALWGGAKGMGSYLLTGGGLIFTGGGFLILSSRLPKKLEFCNDQAALIIHEGLGSSVPPVILPYDDIEGFQIRRHVSRSGRTTSVQWVVDLLKTDGAFWTLYSSNSEAKSEKLLSKLIERVNLSREFSGSVLDRPIKGVSFSESQGNLEIKWPVRFQMSRLILFVMVFCGFGVVVWGARPDMGAIAYGVLGFLGLIFALFLYSVFASIGKTQIVSVSEDTITASQKGGLLPSGHGFSLPIKDCKAILFNYSINSEDSALFFLRESERENIKRMKQGDVGLSDLGSIVSMAMNANVIHLQGHTIGEMLYVEQLLQDKIAERSGHRPD